jgi:hypothetical protein
MKRIPATIIFGGALLLSVATLALSVVVESDLFGFSLAASLLILVGSFLMIRVPHNRVGLVLALGGAAWLLYSSAGDYARLSLQSESGPFPGEHLAAWLGSWVGALLPASLVALLMIFPDGRPPRRWGWLAIGLIIILCLALGGAGLLWDLPTEALTDFERLDREPDYMWVDLAFVLGFAWVLPVTASLVSRFRRGNRTQRQQIKWLMTAAMSFVVVFVGGNVIGVDNRPIWEWLVTLAVAFLPIAVAFAVVRYRLYDIDKIISRTVTYGAVVGLLGVLVLSLVGALTVFLPSDDPLVVAVSTLVAAALFNPLRRRVQEVIDRRFNRSRYDAQRVIGRFTASLQEQVDPGEVVEGWVEVVEDTMQPAAVGVWVRDGS